MQQTEVRPVHSSNDRPNIRKESMADFTVVVLFADLFTESCAVCAKKSQGEVTTDRELGMRADILNQFTWQKCITKRVHFYRRKILVLKSWPCKCTIYKERDPKGLVFFLRFLDEKLSSNGIFLCSMKHVLQSVGHKSVLKRFAKMWPEKSGWGHSWHQ